MDVSNLHDGNRNSPEGLIWFTSLEGGRAGIQWHLEPGPATLRARLFLSVFGLFLCANPLAPKKSYFQGRDIGPHVSQVLHQEEVASLPHDLPGEGYSSKEGRWFCPENGDKPGGLNTIYLSVWFVRPSNNTHQALAVKG